MPRNQSRGSRGSTTKVGDTLEFEGPSNYVLLPDGSVVTARTDVTFRAAGEYVVTNAATGKETTVSVVAAD